jgi:hypothetical protein
MNGRDWEVMRRKEMGKCGRKKITNRESARIPPFGLPESDLLFLTLARRVLSTRRLAPHRERSGKSCRRPSGSREEKWMFMVIFWGAGTRLRRGAARGG